jgi:hypothetical protein
VAAGIRRIKLHASKAADDFMKQTAKADKASAIDEERIAAEKEVLNQHQQKADQDD